jgi:hypothetical protein
VRQFRTPGSVRGEGSAASAVTPSPARSIALQAFEVGARFGMASKMIALVSSALQTTPIPPPPSFAMSRQCETVWPIIASHRESGYQAR